MTILKFSRRGTTVNVLRLLWIVITLWNESGIFSYSANRCSWPDSPLTKQVYAEDTRPAHLLVVADPQILDHRSYPGRPAILTYISQILVDLNLRKSWRAALRSNPDAIFFLGDMMDGGRIAMSDEEYEQYYQRFKKVFKTKKDIPVYFIPGNHDTGLGNLDMFSPAAHSRYVSHFGPLNDVVRIANHSIVLIDAPGLVEEDYKRYGHGRSYAKWQAVPGGTIDFVKRFAKGMFLCDDGDRRPKRKNEPTILLTHIPLSRPEGSNCGPLRERGTIHRGVGIGYQNTLGKYSSQFLLDSIRPSLVLSGDDHDYCEYIHSFEQGGSTLRIREVTVKSLSMAMGIRRPGYQLLSLNPSPGPDISHADIPCLMPDQLGIYLSVYIPLLILSLLALLFHTALRSRSFHPWSRSLPSSRKLSRLAREGNVLYENALDGDADEKIPLPVSSETPQYHRGLSWTFTVDGRKRRFSCCCSPSIRSGPWRFICDFLHDVRDIAAYPITIIVLISFWTFMDS
ncbi:Metallo-dependent phosphatase [Dendrothele bispora CBS 962.96]|uniref:Metallo-dependent phosphatase n=1 Tax=Dendrothele bispora (strain CBS 962.96) TaxID=1314807 RepID=A0A4S8MI42_DENBC|nr:Metallo-dependent phosphatase [Dendrothele bispora CBS 962.96]